MLQEKEDIIIEELRYLRAELSLVRETQLEHAGNLASLKVKSGLWSACVSAIVALVAVGWEWRF